MNYYRIIKGMTKFIFKPSFDFKKVAKLPKYTQIYANGIKIK